jgi:hypothetical protein
VNEGSGGGLALGLSLVNTQAELDHVAIYAGDVRTPGPDTMSLAATSTIALRASGGTTKADTVLIHGGGLLTAPSTATAVEVWSGGDFSGNFATILPGRATTLTRGFSFLGPKNKVSLRASLVVPEAPVVSGVGSTESHATDFYALADACPLADRYKLTLTDVTFVHPAALVDETGGDLLVGGEGGCPTYRSVGDLDTATTIVQSKAGLFQVVDKSFIGVFTGMVTLENCPTNDTCAEAVFAGYGTSDRLDRVRLRTGPRPKEQRAPYIVDGTAFSAATSPDVFDLGGSKRTGNLTTRGAFLPSL